MAAESRAPIITCALTGGYHSKTTCPALPEQPDEIVAQGVAAAEAGAAVLHVHARNPDGTNTNNIEIYRDVHARLCAETDAIVQLTTGGGLEHSYEERMVTALLSPEMCSLNMGFVLFFSPDGRPAMLDNPRPQIHWFMREMAERQISPEFEIYNITMIEEVERLSEEGLIFGPVNLGLVLNTASQGGARGTWQNLVDMVRRAPADANIDVIAIGRSQLPLTTMGLTMGLNVRVGLEDNIRYSRAADAVDNAQMVERIVRIARELQLEPATPAQARERLGTRGRDTGAVPTPVVEQETPVIEPPAKADLGAGL